MLHGNRLPALVLAACLSALAGCPATPTVPPKVHKTAEPDKPGITPTTAPVVPTATTKPDATSELVKHAYFGKVLGADGKGVAGVSIKAFIIANNAGQLVTDNGAGLVTDNGAGLIANNAGSIIANNGGQVISTDGASGKARHLLAAAPTTTDANGEFKLEIAEGETFNVEAEQGPDAKAFAQQVTSKTTNLDLTLQPTGTIHGKVAYPDDPKVTDFTGVDVFIPGSSYLAKTASDGSFTITNVPVGSFSLYATKRGLGGGHVEGVKVASKATAEVEKLALKLLPIKLKSVSATSAVPGQVITLSGDYFGAEQGLPFQVRLGGAVLESAKRDDKGTITVTLPDSARSGDLVVEVDGHASNGIHLDVLTGFYLMAPSQIELNGTITVAATATDPDKRSVPNPALAWKITNGSAATVDAKGTIKAGATPGTVTVQASAGSLVASFTLVVGKAAADGVGGRLDSKLNGLKDLAFAPDGKTIYLATQNAILAYDVAADATSVFAGTVSGSKEDREGTGEDARLSGVLGLAADAQGNLVAIEQTCLVGIDKDRKVTILAGQGKDPNVKANPDAEITHKDGIGPTAVLEGPGACAFGKDGVFYFTDGISLCTLVGNTVKRIEKDQLELTDALTVDKDGVPWTVSGEGLRASKAGVEPIMIDGAFDDVTELWHGLLRTDDGNFLASGDGTLYKITPAGKRTVLAGGETAAIADGKGVAARFGASGRLALAPDGALWYAEETALRKISFTADPDHPTVTTVLQGTGGLKKISAAKK